MPLLMPSFYIYYIISLYNVIHIAIENLPKFSFIVLTGSILIFQKASETIQLVI